MVDHKTRIVAVSLTIAAAMLVAVSAMSCGEDLGGQRFAFDALVKKLQSGQLGLGDERHEAIGLGKPIAEMTRTDSQGAHYGFSAYSHEYKVLLLYSYKGKLFAAQYVEGVRGSAAPETWFFCDVDRLSEYITLAKVESKEPESEIDR